jgi:hypothetical protein
MVILEKLFQDVYIGVCFEVLNQPKSGVRYAKNQGNQGQSEGRYLEVKRVHRAR